MEKPYQPKPIKRQYGHRNRAQVHGNHRGAATEADGAPPKASHWAHEEALGIPIDGLGSVAPRRVNGRARTRLQDARDPRGAAIPDVDEPGEPAGGREGRSVRAGPEDHRRHRRALGVGGAPAEEPASGRHRRGVQWMGPAGRGEGACRYVAFALSHDPADTFGVEPIRGIAPRLPPLRSSAFAVHSSRALLTSVSNQSGA